MRHHGRRGLRGGATLLFALLAAAAPGASEEARLDGVVLALPDGGWAREDKGGIVLQKLFPADEAAGRNRPGAALIHVLPAVSAGSFEQNFATAAGLVPELRAEDPMAERDGATVNGHRIRVEHRCCAHREDVSLASTAAGVAGGGKQQFVTLVSMNLRGDDVDAVEAEFAALVRTLRLTEADRPFGVVPGNGDGGLGGIYTTLHTGLVPNAFGGLDFVSESRVLALDEGGLYSRSIPSEPMAEHCRQEPTDCGTYRLQGGGWLGGARRILMRDVADEYGVIEETAEAFARDGDALTIGDARYSPLAPLAAGARFDGTWRYAWASSGSMAGSSGAVSVERTLTLRPDGTFSRTGAAGFMSAHDAGGGTASIAGSSDRPLESGRYAVEGYHLTLSGTDGRSETLSLFMPDGNDGLLVIGGSNYLKADR